MIDYEETFILSYWRTLRTTVDGVSFIDAFYERFLSSSPEVAELFANSDFKTQKNMLLFSLVHVASFNPIHGPDAIMKGLASRHRELSVQPRLYQLWLDSLLDTVKEYDPEYDEDLCESWRRMLAPGIEFMTSENSE